MQWDSVTCALAIDQAPWHGIAFAHSMAKIANNITERHSRRRTRAALLGMAGALVVCAIIFVLGVGRWLVVEDPLEKAQAIAVLSGRMPMRALEAAKLYRQGYAPQIWLTRSQEPGETLNNMDIPFYGEEYYNERVLVHEGVPLGAIHIMKTPIVNTADEMAVFATELRAEDGGSIILVTSRVHTRRTRTLWRKLTGAKQHAIVRAATADPFEPGRWWATSGDALDVVREMLGMLNAWAGLPLHGSK
jgi:uncharacterized SAM-binding protein YcdF (DUF218 family)